MSGHLQRTQMLLEPAQHEALAEIAAREGRSISDVVRQMIRQHLQGETQPVAANARPEGGTVSERIDSIGRQYEQEQQRVATNTVAEDLAALARIREHREAILARRDGLPIDWDFLGR